MGLHAMPMWDLSQECKLGLTSKINYFCTPCEDNNEKSHMILSIDTEKYLTKSNALS